MSRVLRAIHDYEQSQPAATALVSGGNVVNYADLVRQVDTLSEILKDHAGKCAGIALENSMAWVILDLACIQAGIVTVPLPPFFTAAQCEHALHTSGAALLF
ncbi:MAG: AMP-binding protein, partial [Granulosicoccaceae bacterium]